MSTIGKATLQSDENGLVTLQCDRCKSRFKIDCTYLNDELSGNICCPVCGISEALNTFWPHDLRKIAADRKFPERTTESRKYIGANLLVRKQQKHI